MRFTSFLRVKGPVPLTLFEVKIGNLFGEETPEEESEVKEQQK